jgi:hypothetical protein
MRRIVATVATTALAAIIPAVALAQEAAPTVTVEPAVDLFVGQEVEVSVEGMPASSAPTISVCWAVPVTGPGDCELTDFGLYSIQTDADGAGTGTYLLPAGPADRCAEEGACFIVASAGIGATAPHGGTPVVYAVEQPESTTTTAAPTTTTAPPTTTTTTPVPTTTEAPADTTETTIAAVAAEGSDDESGPPIGPMLGGVGALGAIALFFAIRADRRNEKGTA